MGLRLYILIIIPSFASAKQNILAESNLMEDISTSYVESLENISREYDINKVTATELKIIGIFSEEEIKNFLEYRNEFGPLLSIYELQVIEGFHPAKIDQIRHVLYLNDQPKTNFLEKVLHDKNNYSLLRYETTVQEKAGQKAGFLGSSDKLFYRFNSSEKNVYSIGITSEKDSGESFKFDLKNRQFGNDFNSFHFSLYNKGRLEKVLIGDYVLQSGEGLVLGSGLTLGKNYQTILSVKKVLGGINEYKSAGESLFFRGLATKISINEQIKLSLFGSFDHKDATLQLEDKTTFSAINHSGMHRSERELQRKDNISQFDYGSLLTYTKNNWNFELKHVATRFSYPQKKADHLRNINEFAGRHNNTIGLSFDGIFGNSMVFGEIAKSNGWAGILGIMLNLGRFSQLSFLKRFYSPHYWAFYSNSFGESSRTINESGEYIGFHFKPGRRLKVSMYFDYFQFPWVKYQVNGPSQGYEYFLHGIYTFNRNTFLRAKFRKESKELSLLENKIKPLVIREKYNYSVSINNEVTNELELRTRCQGSVNNFNEEITSGFLLAQDFIYSIRKITLSARVMLFQVEDYENRQFIYERNVLYSFSIPFFQNEGLRHYIMLKYKPGKRIQFWVRYSKTSYNNLKENGTGLNKISGSSKTDIKCQVKFIL